jgi:hypothetical protein
MLTIEIRLNGKPIAGATIAPAPSKISGFSNYQVEAVESAAPWVSDFDKNFHTNFQIEDYLQSQSVWALAAEVSKTALERRVSRGFEQPPRRDSA